MEENAEVKEQAEKKWWWTLRRAYEIPDIVSDENAWSFLSRAIANEPGAWAPANADYPHLVGSVAARLVLELGESGELDHALLNSDTDVKAICQKKTPVGGPNATTNSEALKMAIPAAEQVCAYAAEPKNQTAAPLGILVRDLLQNRE
jgi:hypothetical protein